MRHMTWVHEQVQKCDVESIRSASQPRVANAVPTASMSHFVYVTYNACFGKLMVTGNRNNVQTGNLNNNGGHDVSRRTDVESDRSTSQPCWANVEPDASTSFFV